MAVVDVRADHLEQMVHKAQWEEFTFLSDEPLQLGGGLAHPIPIAYFTASVGFCALTQIVRFAELLRVPIDDLRARATSDWDRDGSVLAGTVLAKCLGFSLDLHVISPAPPEHIAAVLQNAHAGCFAEQALTSPIQPCTSATLNGVELDSASARTAGTGSRDARIRHFPVEVNLTHTGGVAHRATWRDFTFCSDEPPHLGGGRAYPIPIAYFVGSVAFCTLTQIVRYADQLEVPVDAVSCRAASHFRREGSVLAGTVQASLERFDVHVDIQSKASTGEIASLLESAHRGCYAQQALVQPVRLDSRATLNGKPLDYAAYPRRLASR